MKYNSILVVTYGRSGSTLLQGLLNSIDNVNIRGENSNFCWGLYLSWKSLQMSFNEQRKNVDQTSSAWYGADKLDTERFIQDAKQLVKNQLLDTSGNKNICYGFKEIRYIENLDELHSYLDFLQKIFPKVAIIFNTRNHSDVESSGFWANSNVKNLSLDLKKADKLFYLYARKNKNTFIMRYEHMIQGIDGIRPLFEFLETPIDEEKIVSILNTPHSYSVKLKTIENAKKIINENSSTATSSNLKLSNDLYLETTSKLKDIKDNNVIVVCIVKDEIIRLPWFLTYYRNLGVSEFIFIDNGSKDGTIEYLLEQKDVMLYHADSQGYSSSKSGRLWMNQLIHKYALRKWVLTIDADELICWPNYKIDKLNGLVKHAQRLGLNKIFTPLIDAYSDKPVSQMEEYIPGNPFEEVCPWIDPVETMYGSFSEEKKLYLYGGPRARFKDEELTKVPPLMTKQCLFYVQKDVKLLNSHFISTITPSPLVAPLLHYKFLPEFSEKIKKALEEGQHWNEGIEYKSYEKNDLVNKVLKVENSIKVTSGFDLAPYVNRLSKTILQALYD